MAGYTPDPDNGVLCGEAFDHDLELVYEDDETTQHTCRTRGCGVEINTDKATGETW